MKLPDGSGTFTASSTPTSILRIESNEGIARNVETMLYDHFQSALDLGIARFLQEGLSYLCTHRVALILASLTLADCAGLDAVRALRKAASASVLLAFSTVANESQLLEAIGAGAHETLCPAELVKPEFRRTIVRAMSRAGQSGMPVGPTSSGLEDVPAAAVRKVAHDLNNAITSINGLANILLARPPAGRVPTRSENPASELPRWSKP